MKKVNWGIIGLGAIAIQFAKGFKNLNNSNLLAIASNNKEKLDKFKVPVKIQFEELVINERGKKEN